MPSNDGEILAHAEGPLPENQVIAGTSNVQKWQLLKPEETSDSNKGLIGISVELVVSLFKKLEQAAEKSDDDDHERATNVRELQKSFQNWADEKSDLDQKLGGAVAVREQLVLHLAKLLGFLKAGKFSFISESLC